MRNQFSPPLAIQPWSRRSVGAPGGPATSRTNVLPRPRSATRRPSGTGARGRPSSPGRGSGTPSRTSSSTKRVVSIFTDPPRPRMMAHTTARVLLPSCCVDRRSDVDEDGSVIGRESRQGVVGNHSAGRTKGPAAVCATAASSLSPPTMPTQPHGPAPGDGRRPPSASSTSGAAGGHHRSRATPCRTGRRSLHPCTPTAAQRPARVTQLTLHAVDHRRTYLAHDDQSGRHRRPRRP